MIEKINLVEKFGLFNDHWRPRLAAELNDHAVKLAKLKGEFVWHKHDAEDELFLVVRGSLTIRLRDGEVRLGEGEMAVIPRGVEHLPVAEEEAWVVLIEPGSTLNTGDVQSERTVRNPERI